MLLLLLFRLNKLRKIGDRCNRRSHYRTLIILNRLKYNKLIDNNSSCYNLRLLEAFDYRK